MSGRLVRSCIGLGAVFAAAAASGDEPGAPAWHNVTEIMIRDPFVLTVPAEKAYYMYGTTFRSPLSTGDGFDCYRSEDLVRWQGPFPAFHPPADFWGKDDFWAAEVHQYQGRYYMFATMKGPGHFRGTQILVADKPQGPFAPLSDRAVTPANWECLDGTLYVDKQGNPWIVFCHEWTQINDGSICAMRLSGDLKSAAGRPIYLFSASEAPWAVPINGIRKPEDRKFPRYVTDGPFVVHNSKDELLMLWSSAGRSGYTLGLARSKSGTIDGPWEQIPRPLWTKDGGHGMIFQTFDGKRLLALHAPNSRGSQERACFFPVAERDGLLVIEETADK